MQFKVIVDTSVGKNSLYIAAASRTQAAAITRNILKDVNPQVRGIYTV